MDLIEARTPHMEENDGNLQLLNRPVEGERNADACGPYGVFAVIAVQLPVALSIGMAGPR